VVGAAGVPGKAGLNGPSIAGYQASKALTKHLTSFR
jgi:hypothetical protein